MYKGWLEYRKGKGGFKRRWVELRDSLCLVYKSDDRKGLEKSVMLDPLSVIDVDTSEKKPNMFTITLDTIPKNEKDKEKCYSFLAETKVKMSEWIMHMRNARHRVCDMDDQVSLLYVD